MRIAIFLVATCFVGMCAADLTAEEAIQRRRALPQDPVPASAPMRPSRLPLTAISAAVHPPDSLVLFKDHELHEPVFGKVGTVLHGARIVAITRSLVTLSEGGALTYLEVQEAPDVFCSTEGGCRIRRRALDGTRWATASSSSTPLRVDPQRHGFKIFGVSAPSRAAFFGLRNGDTVLRINGISPETEGAMLACYAALQEAAQIDIELERDGEVMHLRYDVTDDMP